MAVATRSRYARNGDLRRKLRRRLASLGLPCAICGREIDYSLPAGDPGAFEVDEIIPVSLGGDELDFSNLQPAHRICNQRKGNKIGFTCRGPASGGRARPPSAVSCSRDWRGGGGCPPAPPAARPTALS